ncbi:MAG: DNA translocase FtsK 4TM domain-containing protein [Crocinitomicaceae bacterium]
MMAEDNIIIEKIKKADKPESKGQPKKKAEKPATGRSLNNLGTPTQKKKSRNTIGAFLILLSIYCLLACVSYIFTWKEDQDQVMNRNLFTFLFGEDKAPVTNWLGKFGAWISHLLYYRWFGISSLALSFLAFLFGVKYLLNIKLLPLKRTVLVSSIFMIWSSIFLGYFSSIPNYFGGSFGYFVNEWLSLSVGKFGTLLFIIVTLYAIVTLLFNPDFKAIWNRWAFWGKGEEDEDAVDTKNSVPLTDLNVINTIRDEQVEKDKKSDAISFDEDEEDTIAEEDEEEYDDDFEIAIAKESTVVPATEKLAVEVHDADDELSDAEINDLQREFGDYDPKLDLSSYVLPPIELLKEFGSNGISVNKKELEDNKNKIVETLSHYKIDIAKIKATVGPTVTLYEIIPAPGVRISKIKNLEDDIALSLSALGIRIIAPIPGKGTIGIEVPNSNPEMVSMRSLIASEKFQNSDMELPVVMGKTITNETYTFDLTKLPHLLVAGATGQGKSVGLNAILISILYKKHPAQVKFVLIDPKKVELTLFNKIERHFLAKLPGEEDAIITDTSKVVNTLNSLCIEMDNRYDLLKIASARTIKEYNAKFIARRLNPEKGHHYLPYIVVLIDEFADLIMTAGKEVEHPIARIAQLARAVGIHLIVATQRPSVNVITGMIKANFPARIAFRVLSKIDSRTILDSSGADQLIGRGDMLVSTGADVIRLQCGFVDTPEVEAVCQFIGEQRAYPEAMLLPEYVPEGGESVDVDLDEIDPMFADAARIVVLHQQGSASLLQRKLKLGYNRAGRIVDQLEAHGIIGTFQGSKARDVLYAEITTLDQYLATKGIV